MYSIVYGVCVHICAHIGFGSGPPFARKVSDAWTGLPAGCSPTYAWRRAGVPAVTDQVYRP